MFKMVSLGIATEGQVRGMQTNINQKRFTGQYYMNMWNPKIIDARKKAAGSAPAVSSFGTDSLVCVTGAWATWAACSRPAPSAVCVRATVRDLSDWRDDHCCSIR